MNKLLKVTKCIVSLALIIASFTQTMQKTPSIKDKIAGIPLSQRISLQQEYNKLMNIKIRTPEQEARIEELRTELKNASNAIRFRSRGL